MESERPVFNMGIATLQRIDDILKDLSEYNVNQNFLAVKYNLLELYKESLIVLVKDDKVLEEAAKQWKVIKEKNIEANRSGLDFDDDVPDLLTEFEFFLRKKLAYLLMPKGDNPEEAL